MKYLSSLFILLLLAASAHAQRTLIVDNNENTPGGDLYFTTLEAAILAAEAGDIIQLIPSDNGYSWPNNSDVFQKDDYTIIGMGLNSDLEDNAIRGRSIINDGIRLGYQRSSEVASNIVFDGIVMAGGVATTFANNIIIKNSEINAGIDFSVNDFAVETPITSNVILRNNILIIPSGLTVNDGRVESFIYQNNIIYTGSDFCEFRNALVSHNLIFSNPTTGDINGVNNQFINNIIANFQGTSNLTSSSFNFNLMEVPLDQNGSSSGNNNIIKSFDLPTLLDDNRITLGAWNREWEVTSQDSDIVGKASDGTNIGPTGGTIPFKKIDYSLPVITNLQVPTTFKVGSNPEITIKAKGN